MRQPSIILYILLFMLLAILPTSAVVRGGVEYSIPIDYSKLSEKEIEIKARNYFHNATKIKDGKIEEDLTNALMLYNILQHLNPENIEYAVRLGALYDKLSMDRYAKGYYSKAIGIDKSSPYGYFYFGEYYYKRERYKKALSYYKEALNRGLENDYELNFKMGDIYEKFGDTERSLIHLKKSFEQSPNPDLELKIQRVEKLDAINKEF